MKRASVAIVLVEAEKAADGAAFVLTRRASSLRSHRGQWALPGGRCDEGETAVAAALRELMEELGLSLNEQHVLGMLDEYPTRSGYLVTPVVLWSKRGAVLTPNPDEVASVHRIALADLEHADAFDFTAIPESARRVIRFRLAGQFDPRADGGDDLSVQRNAGRPRHPRCRTRTAGVCLEITWLQARKERRGTSHLRRGTG